MSHPDEAAEAREAIKAELLWCIKAVCRSHISPPVPVLSELGAIANLVIVTDGGREYTVSIMAEPIAQPLRKKGGPAAPSD